MYFPQQAELAVEHFFRKGNLIALRELALRTTAERVATDILLYRQGEGITQIWPTKDKILVCVGPRTESLKLIRAAKRIANSLQAEWLAVYIDTPQFQRSTQHRNRAIQNLRLAEQLGAITHVLTGFDIVKEVIDFAHQHNVTQIIIWKQIRTRWQNWFRRNLADEILRHSADIDVYIMTGQTSMPPPPKNNTHSTVPWKTYGLSLAIVCLTTVINLTLYPYLTASNLVMLYLLGVTLVALFGQVGPSVFASLLSVIAYDYFFIAPYYSLAVSGVQYFFTLIVMLLVTQIMSYLTIMTRRQSESAKLIQHQTAALYTLSRQLTSTRGVRNLVELGTRYIDSVFNSEVMVLLPRKNHLEVINPTSPQEKLDPKEYGIAAWVYEMGQVAGLGTDTLSFSNALYLPLFASLGPIGVIRIQPRAHQLFTPEQKGVLESCINQLALALEVDRLQEKAQQKELKLETDRARNALLQAISNDLDTPLRIIISATNTFGKEIHYEIEKLSQLNENILQIIQLETEELSLKKEPASLRTVINLVVKLSEKMLHERPVHLHIPKKIPEVPLNKPLIQRALINLIDNAVKFSPAKSAIEIRVIIEETLAVVSVEDCGPGVLLDEKSKLFEKFYRGKQLVTGHGLGLGLTICQKIIVAHGGTIWVENIEERGAAFRFTLPLTDDSMSL